MNSVRRLTGKKGFTLIELLVVIAIIAILAAILIPTINQALLRGAATRAMANGKSIYTSVFAKEMDSMVIMSDDESFPLMEEARTGDTVFDTSTDYFRYLVTNRILNVSFEFFAERRVSPYRDSDPTGFQPRHNSWCVTADLVDATPDGVPFLFTRNSQIDRTGEHSTLGDTPVYREEVLDPDAFPFGDQALVAIFKGGSAYTMLDDQVTYNNFNPADIDKVVLRPGEEY